MDDLIALLTGTQTTTLLTTLIAIGVSIIAGIFAGNSAVYLFNRIPPEWFCDYGEKPSEELLQKDSQRLKSHPWKALFSVLFSLAGIVMSLYDPLYAVGGMLALWILLLIAVADKKYMIIPDQFTLFLAITACAFIPWHAHFLNILWGALLGGGCMLLVGATGRLLFKKDTLGFGDVKLFCAIGLIAGLHGTALILIASSFLSAIAYAFGLARKKIKPADEQALAPYIAFAASLYLVFSPFFT